MDYEAAMAPNIETVALERLVEDPKNARMHPEKNLTAIKQSLQEYGQVEPLIVRRQTNVVIGGNGRLECMRALGWESANVVFLDIDEARANALSLALNRTSELAEWDEQKLFGLLEELVTDEDTLVAFTGFDEQALSSMLGSFEPDLGDFQKDELEKPKPTEKPAPTGDGSWFYIEYYGDDEKFLELKSLLAEKMTGLHEIEPAFFESMVRGAMGN